MITVYLFHGEDSYSSHQKAIHWKNEFEKKYGDLNTELLETLTLNNFKESINTLPFLSDKKFIIIQNCLSETPTEELKKIAKLIPEIPNYAIVVFVERNKADQRTSIFKTIKTHGQITEFKLKDTPEITKWILMETKKLDTEISNNTAKHLAETVGPNLWQISKEIEKLIVHTNKQEIKIEDIDKLTTANIQTTIFILTDNLSKKNLKESLKSLNKLIESGANLIPTLYSIATHFRTLIQVKKYIEKNILKPQIISKTKKHPFVITKAIEQSKNFQLESLINIYERIISLDKELKTGKIKISTQDQSELRLSIEKLIADFCKEK